VEHSAPPAAAAVVVIGGGHAGIEAALAAARMGASTLLVTLRRDGIGRMPCNPAIGGQGKGHLVREIDALGGEMGLATDATSIQFKYLNTRKGLAVRSSRAQVDRFLYQRRMGRTLLAQAGLRVLEGEAASLRIEAGRVSALILADGSAVPCRAVVVTTGTYLGGRLHTGVDRRPGGGNGAPSAYALSAALAQAGHRMGRLKTGTVPRVDGRTIDWASLPPQEGDAPGGRFSFLGPPSPLPQVVCRVTRTTEATHEVLRRGLRHSPLYGEDRAIVGRGPRYCPSIEDKIHRFADKETHRIFLEPEGLATFEVYPNGFSTSLPVSVQQQALRTLPGMSRAVVVRPGYAIEYDFADPRDLAPTLQSRLLQGLFLAGQINGTTGYEEAAAQGLLAGINAALLASGREAVTVRRDEAYLGVLVDDLVRLGADEPYRMFTSRAEWRLQLREDNADLRLTPLGRRVGLVDDARQAAFERRREAIARGLAWMASTRARIQGAEQPLSLLDLAQWREKDFDTELVAAGLSPPDGVDGAAMEQVLIECRYSGYLRREREEIARLRELGETALPSGLDYAAIPGLRGELVEKLGARRPATLDEAARIQGITPAALALLAAKARQLGSPAPR
jgi:tRNA uridine 5-carboxymethylaminomethyl modification enzyme